ncbi:hypothetical protein QAD02_022443 [Eretmocerus hayati]|uniref:Uncharacterized protein n=1 Tax=Eretmocerus hayati TaxID=131215 RepID=A0ACC2PSS8_9HYME|nr:hypothetical protein QAD02_022443 [Eretmocerus hayati]
MLNLTLSPPALTMYRSLQRDVIPARDVAFGRRIRAGITLASLPSYARCTDEALLELGRAILRSRRFADDAPDDVDVARPSYAVDGPLKYGVLERGHLHEVFMCRHDGCRQNFAVTVFRVVSQTVWYGVGAAGGGRFYMVSGGRMRVPVCPDHGVIGARDYVCPGLVVGNPSVVRSCLRVRSVRLSLVDRKNAYAEATYLPPVSANVNVTPVFYLDASEVDLHFDDGLSVITELDCQEEKLSSKAEELKVFDDSIKFEDASLADLDRIQTDDLFVIDGVLVDSCPADEISECEIVECGPFERDTPKCNNDVASPLLIVRQSLTVEEYANIERAQDSVSFPVKRQRGRPKGKRLPKTKNSKRAPRTKKMSADCASGIATPLGDASFVNQDAPPEVGNFPSTRRDALGSDSSVAGHAVSHPRRSLPKLVPNQTPCRRSERLRLARGDARQNATMLENDVLEISTPQPSSVTNFTRPTVIVSTSSVGIVPSVDAIRPKPKITNVVTLSKGLSPLIEKPKSQIPIASTSFDDCTDDVNRFFNRGLVNELAIVRPRETFVAASPRYAEIRGVVPIIALNRLEGDPLIYYLRHRISYSRASYRFIVLNIRNFEVSYAAVLAVRKEISVLEERIALRADRLRSTVRDAKCRCLSCKAHTGNASRITAIICQKCL